MDEKTEQLRDIFIDVAEEETVTESQEESRGSLVSDSAAEDRVRAVIEAMRDRFSFRTSLSDEDLVTVARAFYAGRSDAEIADDLEDCSPETVRGARLDLHLVTDDDTDAPFDLDDLRRGLEGNRSITALATDLDASESTVRRYRRVVQAQERRRTVSDRFREEFEHLLGDQNLGERLTASVHDDGLEDATEGMETNVSF